MINSIGAIPPVEKAVDPLLGYPLAFAKLCHHSSASLYSDSPPFCFLPYPLSAFKAAKLREYESLFPPSCIKEEELSVSKEHADFLWTQLDHLGNAGFDPAKFRIDPYGNVLHCNVDPSSPLAWTIDHWFPRSRGGMTRVENLRLVQWQVAQNKGQQLEFLVPWWDLQVGISVNQFLSIFTSQNSNFRQRAFLLLFPNCNSNSYPELENHIWPHQFKQRAKQDGFAAAALVRVKKHPQFQVRAWNATTDALGSPPSCNWRAEDEEALLIALQKYRPVEQECVFATSSDTKEFHPLDGCGKEELMMRHSWVLMSIKQEQETWDALGLEIQQRKDHVTHMEKELEVIKQQNEVEKTALEELESILEKHKKRAEKQRRWSETQAHYRQCLERIIRDTLHQSFVFKEKTRLNKAACTALLGHIQSQKMTCEDADMDTTIRHKEREVLETFAQPHIMEFLCRRLIEEGFLTNESFADQKVFTKVFEVGCAQPIHYSDVDDKKCVFEESTKKPPKMMHQAVLKPLRKCMDTIPEEDEHTEGDDEAQQVVHQRSPLKRGRLDVDVGCAYQRQKTEKVYPISHVPNPGAPVGDDSTNHKGGLLKVGDDKQLDELLQEVLTLNENPADVFVDGSENDEQRITRLGKSNVDKWLQRLLNGNPKQSPVLSESMNAEKGYEDKGDHDRYNSLVPAAPMTGSVASAVTVANGEESARKKLGGLFHRVGFRHNAKNLRVLKERVNSACNAVRDEELLGQGPILGNELEMDGGQSREEIHSQPNNTEIVNSGTLEMEKVESVVERPVGDGGSDVLHNELDFVKRMRELREGEKARRSCRFGRLSTSKRPGEEAAMGTSSQKQLDNPSSKKKEGTGAKCFSSDINPIVPDRLTRSFSMRASSSNGKWVLHTRKGSDVLPSNMEGQLMHEEVEIVLRSSSSSHLCEDVVGPRACGQGDKTGTGRGSMGLKASLKTCTRAWKRAVSRRNHSQGTM